MKPNLNTVMVKVAFDNVVHVLESYEAEEAIGELRVLRVEIPDWLCPSVREPELRQVVVLDDGFYNVLKIRRVRQHGDMFLNIGEDISQGSGIHPELISKVQLNNLWQRDLLLEIVLTLDKEKWARIKPAIKSVARALREDET